MNRANESPEQRRQRHENRNQRGRDQRENETPDQQLARQQHRNESDCARRQNETPEEQQQRRQNRNKFDQANHTAADASGEASGDGRYDRHRQLVDAERRAWSVTSEEFFRELDEKKGTFLDDKIEYDPFKAVVMYYLNSGIARFEGLTEFDPMCSTWTEDEINAHYDKIKKEVEDEIMTDEEINDTIQAYLNQRDPGNSRDLLSCAACGIRKESMESTPAAYMEVKLKDLPWFMELNEEEQAELDKLKEIAVTVPVDEKGNTRIIEVWQAVSVFDWQNKLYHLHPELVDKTRQSVYLCRSCYHGIMEESKRPPESIAAGIDFGNYIRLGLEKQNLHEQSIISRFRRYGKVAKVKPNDRGQIKYTMNKIQAHVIMFEHDAPYVASKSFLTAEDMLDHVAGVLRLHFVTADGNVDELVKATLGASTIVGRSFVVFQWLAILQQLHPDFTNVKLPKYEEFRKLFNDAKQKMRQQASYTTGSTDPVSLTHELVAGSDVAAAQQIDSTRTDAPVVPSLADTSPCNDDGPNQDEVPISYSLVTDHLDAGTSNVQERNALLLHAIGKSFNVESEHRGFSHRSADGPANEIDDGNFILRASFPGVFLLGKAYGKWAAKLTNHQRLHLLQQYTNIPAENRNLQAYMYNTHLRAESMWRMSAKRKGDRKSIQEIGLLLEDKDFHQQIKNGQKNSTGKDARYVLNKVLPFLNFGGRKSEYGAIQPHFITAKIYELSRRYGSASTFLTMSLDEKNNGSAFRMTFRTLNNETFPARLKTMEEESTGSQTHGDLLKCLREESTLEGVGRVNIPCRPYDRARAAMESPVAYVTEYKAVIVDVLSTLIGIPPSNISLAERHMTVRKTKYFKHRPKGIFGRALGYYGVHEAHAKGNLHFHLVIWGGISSRVLQKYGGVPRICEAVTRALNSMYNATLPSDVLKERIVKDVICKLDSSDKARTAVAKSSTVPLLLCNRKKEIQQVAQAHGHNPTEERVAQAQVDNPTESSTNNSSVERQLTKNVCKCKAEYLSDLTNFPAGTKQFHGHEATCHKGFNGQTGCRFCRPYALCKETRPVIIEPENVVNTDGVVVNETYKVINTIPPPNFSNGPPDPIDKPDPTLVVWELQRDSLHGTLPLPEANSTDKDKLQFELSYLKVNDNPELSDYLANLTCEQLNRVYQETAKRIESSNGYVVEYSPILTFCTGSHNNSACLGSSEQGKAALFYLSSYFSKNKQALDQCLSVLSAACKQTKKFPSTAKDSGTTLRTAQHILTHTLNNLHLKMEVTDYQVAAALLDLPSEMCSDNFSYMKPHDSIVYTAWDKGHKYLEKRDDTDWQEYNERLDEMERNTADESEQQQSLHDFIDDDSNSSSAGDDYNDHASRPPSVEPATTERVIVDVDHNGVGHELDIDMFQSLGPAPFYRIDNGRTVAVPYPVHYRFRGKELQFLNRSEYNALVITKKRRETHCSTKGHIASTQFLYGDGYLLGPFFAQFLRSKHHILLCAGKPPKPPGLRPSEPGREQKQWQNRADTFAKYYLHHFRPEIDLFDGTQINNLDYSWESFQQWKANLLADGSLISKLRLQALHNYIYGLDTSFQAKKLLSQYRGRCRDQWTPDQQATYAREAYLASVEENDELDEDTFEIRHKDLPIRTNKEMLKAIKYDEAQLTKFNDITKKLREYQLPSCSTQHVSHRDHQAHDIQSSIWHFSTVDEHNDVMLKGDDVLIRNLSDNDSDDFNATTSQHQEDSTSEPDNSIGLTQQQQQIFNIYKEAKYNRRKLPPIMLVTGPPGTGKTVLQDRIQNELKDTKAFATMGITAVMAGGSTFASTLHFPYDPNPRNSGTTRQKRKRCEADMSIHPFTDTQLENFCNELDMENLLLIVIDELSNVPPMIFAALHCRLCQAMNNDIPFGGIPLFITGDFSQNPPVSGTLFTKAVMEMVVHDHNFEQQRKRLKLTESKATSNASTEPCPAPGNTNPSKRFKTSSQKYSTLSKFRQACELLITARWMELTEQVRAAKDPQHVQFVNKMSRGETIEIADFRKYKLLSNNDFDPSSKDGSWAGTLIIVTTNRERHTLTHIQSQLFAKSRSTCVIRWPSLHQSWKQKPLPACVETCINNDPCFF